MRRFARVLATTLALTLAGPCGFPCGAFADWTATLPMRAPGTSVVLDLPTGYSPSKLMTGFGNEAIETTIVVTERPGASLEQLAQSLTAEALAAAGMRDVEAGRLARSDRHIYLVAVRPTGEEVYTSFLLAFEDEAGAAIITANVPSRFLSAGTVRRAEIETALASARRTATDP